MWRKKSAHNLPTIATKKKEHGTSCIQLNESRLQGLDQAPKKCNPRTTSEFTLHAAFPRRDYHSHGVHRLRGIPNDHSAKPVSHMQHQRWITQRRAGTSAIVANGPICHRSTSFQELTTTESFRNTTPNSSVTHRKTV